MLNENILGEIEKKIIDVLKTEVKDIIVETRKNMVVVEEKKDGDSATLADVKIGELFDHLLPTLVEGAIVIQEESFDEKVYDKLSSSKYVWVVDPIDGTKAFRDLNNHEWCVGICLFENLNPILSFVYIPEMWLDKPYLLSANKYKEGIYNYGERLILEDNSKECKYVSHTHKSTERNETENKIASLFENNEMIRAYAGHSTLAQFAEVALKIDSKVFSRREANVWDITQSAYLISKIGGEVYYENGNNIFPLDLNLIEYNDHHLIMKPTIASSKINKEKIIDIINK